MGSLLKPLAFMAGYTALLALAGPSFSQASAAPSAPGASASSLPPGPGLDLIKERCVACHTLSTILKDHKTPDDWAATVQVMADRGADVSPDEIKVIADYLAKTLPPTPGATSSGAPSGSAP